MSEVQRKLAFVREILREQNLLGVRLRGVDWFSWITGGGTSVVIMTAEIGIAEVFITESEAWILTNRIENVRLENEEVSTDFKVTSFPWQDTEAADKFVSERTPSAKVCSDRPRGPEQPVPATLLRYKTIMQPEEILRYRSLGLAAAEAMTDAMMQANPEWTEQQLAGAGAEALWKRGIEPTLILVASEQRGLQFRHPIAKSEPLGGSAMMVFCARKNGLYANFTRFIFFRDQKSIEAERFRQLRQIEAEAFSAIREGKTLGEVYSALAAGYANAGLKSEINLHHQGGTTGYLSREEVAGPHSTTKIADGMVFAWNPSLPGAKIEDTVLLQNGRVEILTQDPRWPSSFVNGIERPEVWIKR